MIWKKITINTTVEATDIVASVLFENNIIGAEIEDNQNLSEEELKKMYVDIPKINIDDGKSKVSFYVSIGDKPDDIYKDVDKSVVDISYIKSNDNIFTKKEFDGIMSNIVIELKSYQDFMDMGSLYIEETELDDKNFLTKWKNNFKSLEIDNINILPNWEKPKDDKINILIEPGNAFGTGQHATTKLCVKAIIDKTKSLCKPFSLLDIGTGSGILGIIAHKLDANKVVAIDIDENCEFNLIENLKLNNIKSFSKINSESVNNKVYDSDFIYGFGNVLTDEMFLKSVSSIKYDIVVVNILAPVIISLIKNKILCQLVKSGGYVILSGIITEMKNEVEAALRNEKCYENIEINSENDWVSAVCRYK